MNEKNKVLIKNVLLFTLGSFGSKIVTFLMVPLYTAVLSTSDYGTVDLLQSTAQLLIPILLLSIQDATLRFSMDPKYEIKDVLSTTFRIIIIGTIVLIVCLVAGCLLGLFKISTLYLLFLFFSFELGAVNNCLNLYLKAKNQASTIAFSGILCTVATCLSNVVLLLVFKLGVIGYMISNTVGLFLQVFYQFFVGKVYKDLRLSNFKNLSKPMIKYSSPLIANSIAWWVNNASDRYILTLISGISANGIYAVSYKIPTILTTFQNIFYNAWSISAISEFDKNDTDGFIGNNYSFYSFISMIACLALLLVNIPMASVLYSNDFFQAWQCVPFLLVGTVFNGIAQFEGSLFAAVKKTKSVALTTVLGAIINIIMNLLFIPRWGAIGAAFATMIGYFVMWILRTILLHRFVQMKVKWNLHYLSISLIMINAILATLNIVFGIQIIIAVLILICNKNQLDAMINILKKRIFKKK